MAIEALNQRIPLPEPKWFHTEKTAKITGVALIVLGSLNALASVGMIVAGALSAPIGVGLIAGGACNLALSISLIAGGILLLKKECWNDPVFIDRIAAKVQTLTFDQIIDEYGYQHTSDFHFISKQALTEKFLEKNLSYKEIFENYSRSFHQFNIVDWSAFYPLLMADIQANGLSLSTLKEKYGNQPIKDGVISPQDPWLQGQLLHEIKDKSYETIIYQFSAEISKGALTRQDMRTEMLRQYEALVTFDAYFKDQGQRSFFKMLKDGILAGNKFADKARLETSNMTVLEIVKQYSWSMFSHGILSGPELNQRFMQEIQEWTFSSLPYHYGWDFLTHGLATGAQLKPKALQEIQVQNFSFLQMLQSYGWKPFEVGILSGHDPLVRGRFHDLAKTLTFCELWDDYSKVIEKYHLLNDNLLLTAKHLAKERVQIEEHHKREVGLVKKTYDLKVKSALDLANEQKVLSEKVVNDLRRLLFQEKEESFTTDHLRAQIKEAEKRHEENCSRVDKITTEKVTFAKLEQETGIELSKIALEKALHQINASFHEKLI